MVIPASILLVHLYVIRAVVISVTALVLEVELIAVVSSPFLFWLTTLISFAAHCIANIAFYTFVPQNHMRIMKASSEIVMFFFVIGIVLITYMIYNASFYRLDSLATGINIQQIILPLTLLLVFYLSLLMMIKIVSLHYYKERASMLEETINKEKVLKSALFNMTKVFVEFNCTTNTLLRLVINERDSDTSAYKSFSSFVDVVSKKYTHPQDIDKTQSLSPQNIIFEFNKGVTEIVYEYRAFHLPTEKVPNQSNRSSDYVWHKLLMQSKKSAETGDILGFCLIYEIHDEKEVQLALQTKAETDPLTGGFNKDAAQKYIHNHLHNNPKGTFFVIDLDHFKEINDTFGHSFGDTVLQTVYTKIRNHFRPSDILARIGGDEFIAFTPTKLNSNSLKSKAQKICEAIKHTYTSDNGKNITISASIGISHAPEDGLDYSYLFNSADKAMYSSKEQGKDTFTIYLPKT